MYLRFQCKSHVHVQFQGLSVNIQSKDLPVAVCIQVNLHVIQMGKEM